MMWQCVYILEGGVSAGATTECSCVAIPMSHASNFKVCAVLLMLPGLSSCLQFALRE